MSSGFAARVVYRGSQALGIGDIYSGKITVPWGVSGVVVVLAVVCEVEGADEVLFAEEEVLVLVAVFNVECVDEVLFAEVVVVVFNVECVDEVEVVLVVFNVECVDEVLFAEVVVVVFNVECVEEVLFTEVVLVAVFNVECVDEVLVVEDVDLCLVLSDAAVEAETTRNINKRESNMLKNKRRASSLDSQEEDEY